MQGSHEDKEPSLAYSDESLLNEGERTVIEERIRRWAGERRLPERWIARWLSLAEVDQVALLTLAEGLHLRTGQLVTLIELLDEISVRENVAISSILERRELRHVIEGNGSAPERARRVVEALRVMRFPRLRQMAERLAREVAELKLPANIRVIMPKDLESDELRLEVRAHGGDELGQSIRWLAEKQAALCRLADMIGGADEV